MPLSRSRDYLSIGEVLEAVRSDFPDVSISKIRFLESEGLLTPERTPSGYRKFYEADVGRLRTILQLQRDHFMPLRVIKDRLAQGTLDEPPATSLGVAPEGAPPAGAASPNGAGASLPATDVSLTQGELADSAGLAAEALRGLIDFGLIPDKGDGPYDGTDLVAAKAAARLLGFGLEPRHLRMYKQMVDRETGLFQQIVAPTLHKGDSGGERARETLTELVRHSGQLRDALLRATLDTH